MGWSGGHYSAYPVEWHGYHYSVIGCYVLVYCLQCPPSGVERTQWSGTVAIIVCVGCIRLYYIVDCAHPVEWNGGHYSRYPVEWHGGHYSVLGCILFYYIVYSVHRVEWSGPSEVARWPL